MLRKAELEQAVVSISAELETLPCATDVAMQKVAGTAEHTGRDNRFTLDYLLASQGGVCEHVNSSCTVHVGK